MKLYLYLADLVVVIHAAYVGVVVFGLLAILVGRLARWKWVRNFWFRAVHFLMILIVVAQALADKLCPLTTLENYLRVKGGGKAYYGSFIGHWFHEVVFCDIPQRALTPYYCLFGAVVLATFFLVPPRWPKLKRRKSHPPAEA
jgi:hypothetical protein